jgi:hypothetical protein
LKGREEIAHDLRTIRVLQGPGARVLIQSSGSEGLSGSLTICSNGGRRVRGRHRSASETRLPVATAAGLCRRCAEAGMLRTPRDRGFALVSRKPAQCESADLLNSIHRILRARPSKPPSRLSCANLYCFDVDKQTS